MSRPSSPYGETKLSVLSKVWFDEIKGRDLSPSQHFRDIRQRHQLLTGLQRPDHLLSRSMQDLRAQPFDPAIASFDPVAHPLQQPVLFCKPPGRHVNESDIEDLSTLIT
jgi:hypothetical protein